MCALCVHCIGRANKQIDLSTIKHHERADFLSHLMPHWSRNDLRLPCGLCAKCCKAVDRSIAGSTMRNLSGIDDLEKRYQQVTEKRQVVEQTHDPDCLVCFAPRPNWHVSPKIGRTPAMSQDVTVDVKVETVDVATNTQQPRLSHAFMYDVQNELGLSDNQLIRLAHKLREGLDDRKLIEPNLEREMRTRNLVLVDLFETCDFHEQPAVFCTDCMELVSRVAAERRFNVADIELLKINIDAGRGFLKISLNVLFGDERKTVRYRNGRRVFKDSGVRRSFLLGIVPNVAESFENVSDMLRRCVLPQGIVLCADLKIINIVLGLQSHSATFPCPYCDSRRGNRTQSMKGLNYRTFEGINSMASAYKAKFADPSSPSSRKQLFMFYGCEHGPMPGLFPEVGRVIDYVPLSELHLLLGIVAKIINAFESHSNRRVVNICVQWLNTLNVMKAAYRGEFNGNDCALLISERGVERLRSIIAEDTNNVSSRLHRRKAPRQSDPAALFADTFSTFGKLVRGIFGALLDPNWRHLIKNFTTDYLALNISVTSKVHIVFVHLSDWIETHNDSLGRFSEQAGEAIHHDFDIRWNDFRMRMKTWEEGTRLSVSQERAISAEKVQWCQFFGNRLLRAVCAYNGAHLWACRV